MVHTVGKVYLVGAGPGDPGLITIKATQVLAQADVVLYDALSHPNLLRYAKHADCIFVGKKKGQHSAKQVDINARLISLAKEGKTVVRLKGGDPLIFGRGGEEMTVLAAENIPFEVVPGISAGLSVPACAGIPLTHRSLSRSVAFVTGTTLDGSVIEEKPLPDADTLVFFMAVSHLRAITQGLLKQERFTKQTPVALIYNGSTAKQKVLLGTLETIYEIKEAAKLMPPALLVVGEVVALSEELAWWEARPLSGKRVVVLRQADNGDLAAQRLSALGAEVIHIPMLDIVPIKDSLKQINKEELQALEYVIFTSQNAVTVFKETLLSKGLDTRTLANTTIVSIGKKTDTALANMGLVADIRPVESLSAEIAELFEETNRAERMLIPCAKKANPALSQKLKEKGYDVSVLAIYDTHIPSHFVGHIHGGDHVFFTSPSTVEHLIQSKVWDDQDIVAHSIGSVTTKALKKADKNVTIVEANQASVEAMIETMLGYQHDS